MTGKEHWRIEKRRDVSGYGREVTSKVAAYEQTWRSRCYIDDLPDEVPNELMRAGLAPSWKAVAVSILLNRYCLLGIYPTGGLFFDKPKRDDAQLVLPLGIG